jgi:hypothetical protein
MQLVRDNRINEIGARNSPLPLVLRLFLVYWVGHFEGLYFAPLASFLLLLLTRLLEED